MKKYIDAINKRYEENKKKADKLIEQEDFLNAAYVIGENLGLLEAEKIIYTK